MLRIAGLRKAFPDGARPVVAVEDFSLEVAPGSFTTLLGPSGCGKTTVLRCVAGLERPDAGVVEIAGRTVFAPGRVDAPAVDRGVGMVFQSYALWPHLSVRRTVAFPLEVRSRRERPARTEIARRVDAALAAVRLKGVHDRPATDLSGGQQQRLALARALVAEPAVLLMDEPLASLDTGLREEIRFELKRLQRRLGVTILYVTHDQGEALALSDVVAVLRAGRIEQQGSPEAIYERPASPFVADFMGVANVVAGVVDGAARVNGTSAVALTGGLVVRVRATELAPGTPVSLGVRSDRVAIEPAGVGAPAHNRFGGRVEARTYLGDAAEVVVRVGELELRARCRASECPPGSEVTVYLPPEACAVLPRG